MKKISILLILLSLISNFSLAFASTLPNAFWGYNEKYASAVEAKDNYQIIENGLKILDVIKNEPVTEQIVEISASRLDQIGLAYERLGMYEKAGEVYSRYIPFANQLNWEDGVVIAKAKVLQYKNNIDVYTSKESLSDKIFMGTNFDGETRQTFDQETMILVYLEFGDNNFLWVEKTLQEARQKGKVVELALNLPGEGSQVGSVMSSENYLKNLKNLINKYSDVTVLLRFAAEMNIWTNLADPQAFINAFRFVHDTIKSSAANVKMVWSVNQVSSWGVEMNDYYPGDEYVDYVGVSLYLQKYFLGRNDWSEFESFNSIVFLTGDSADPVNALTEVMVKYGYKKPVIIAEGGVSHYIRPVNEDSTDWAIMSLRKMYGYLPIVYPQIKLMAYFDREMTHEVNDYTLSNNIALQNEYKKIVNLPHFKGNVRYTKLDSAYTIEQMKQTLYTYVHIYKKDISKVNYYIDGALAATSTQIPFSADIDFTQYSLGHHNLRVEVFSGTDAIKDKSYDFNLIEKPITVTLNGQKILFDTDPILHNSRTLVPMRLIFEALGIDVLWDASTETITSKMNNTTIKMQIGNDKMYKNDEIITLDVPPQIFSSRTMVPVRAITEALGATVDWHDSSREVVIKVVDIIN